MGLLLHPADIFRKEERGGWGGQKVISVKICLSATREILFLVGEIICVLTLFFSPVTKPPPASPPPPPPSSVGLMLPLSA